MNDSNYPLGVSSRDFDADSRTQTLVIEDVLAKKYIEVDGIEYDTHATARFIRRGENGPIELVDLETRSLYVIVYRTIGAENLPLDMEHLRSGIKDDIRRAIEAEAMRQASISPDWEPEESEDL